MRFNVHALDAQQQVVALSLDAASETLARDMAEQRGLAVFSIEGKTTLPRLRRVGAFKPALFSIELLSLLEAGLNLVEAMHTLPDKDVAGERHQRLSGAVAAL